MAFEVPEALQYLETHEWTDIDDGVATIGITEFAQDELGDVVYVELPSVGDELEPSEQFGSIESLKAVSDLYTAAGGEVVAVNEELRDAPELINEDPYGDGWMLKIERSDAELAETLSAEEYREQTA
jgi:glycine cleavage system H protein